jgi:hypothetical protein
MTFEKRWERLTARHETLTHSVEMPGKPVQTLKGIAERSLASINALARIAQSHERRITNLEAGRIDSPAIETL